MRLIRPPRRPMCAPAVRITIGLRSAPESWRDHLYGNLDLNNACERAGVALLPVLTGLEPGRGTDGAQLWLRGDGLHQTECTSDIATIDAVPPRMAFAAGDRRAVVVPGGLDGG